MARVADLIAAGRTYSFEFFPPKTPEAEAALDQALVELEPLGPSFVSVTYGAGGTTRARTHDIVVRLQRSGTMTPVAHLTCAAHTRAELVEILGAYRDAGVENILALGGDPPVGDSAPGELRHACELVDLAREVGTFCVGVAAHPEGHPRSMDLDTDRQHLAAKLRDADFALTQFFFELEPYMRMMEGLSRLGVDKPVVPGLMPITNVASVKRMAQLSGTEVPAWLRERLEAVAHDPEAVRQVGVDVATALAADLLDAGAPGLHFYTLNRSSATREIYANLGLAPAA